MSITIPGELEWLGWIAGSDWPDGDEDKMWGIGGDWRTAATDLRDLLPELRSARQATIAAYPWGDGLDAMVKALDQLDHGPESLEHLAEILDAVAESADGLGTEIEYTKILIISSLAMLAVEIAAAWLFPPTAPLAETLAIGATRVAVRLLGERAVSAIARFAAKTGLAALTKFAAKHVVFSTVLGAGQDLAIQAYQVGAGHRDGIDWERVGTTAYTAAAAGAVGGPAGSLLGKAAGKVHLPDGRFGDAVKGAAVGAGAGIAGGLGAWGIGGFANGWTWDPRILTSAGAYGVTVGGSKGFRHSPTAGGAGTHPFNAADPALLGGESPRAPGHGHDGSTPSPAAGRENGGEQSGAADRPGAPTPVGGEQRNGSPTTEHGSVPHPQSSADGPASKGTGPEGSAPESSRQSAAPEPRGGGPASLGSGGEGRAAGAGGPATGAEGRQAISEPRNGAGENRVTPPGGESRATESPSKPGESNAQRAGTGENRRPDGEPRAGVPESRTANRGETNVSSGRREADLPAAQRESPIARQAQVHAGEAGSGSTGQHGSPPPAHAPDPLTQARDTLRSLGVDPDGMSPRELERASADAIMRRIGELTAAADDLANQNLGPAEFFARRDAIQQQISDTMALRGQMRSLFEQHRAGTTPPAPAPAHSPAVETQPHPTSTPKTEPAPAPEPKPEAAPEGKSTAQEQQSRAGDGLDAAREKLRRLGVDPDGMSPEQMRRAAEEAFARKADEFADRTAALEGAGLRPGEFRVQRMELQKQIDEFLGMRRELRSDLPEARIAEGEEPKSTEKPKPAQEPTNTEEPNTAEQPKAAEEPTSPEEPSSAEQPENRQPAPPRAAEGEPEAETGAGEQSPEAPEPQEEFPDTTSKIPYTPRYFTLPPITPFEAAAPPPDSVWEPDPSPSTPPVPGGNGEHGSGAGDLANCERGAGRRSVLWPRAAVDGGASAG
ncbi:hypothetical protein KHQ06_33705 [Nocardia tengchongensis]|uniref:Outer membrane channel protein CpnT-like N-terminal domain-containing protein n=1 Tax=Nocardia tengchongensis TaxID=2055889 RepID=A0ABX8CR11_9NOCA|nr:hypothetical protein [Nocardia tengchongensis]QVI20970.1 hypothetical protein KHQ06_33705 [Nocardia tengchongensis]